MARNGTDQLELPGIVPDHQKPQSDDGPLDFTNGWKGKPEPDGVFEDLGYGKPAQNTTVDCLDDVIGVEESSLLYVPTPSTKLSREQIEVGMLGVEAARRIFEEHAAVRHNDKPS